MRVLRSPARAAVLVTAVVVVTVGMGGGLGELPFGLWPRIAAAYDSLFAQLRVDKQLAELFPESVSRADIEEGVLLGVGTDRIRHLSDGRLSLERKRHYTAVRRSDTHKVAKLPKPWDAVSTLLLEPNLRMVRADTRVSFDRESGDTAFADYKLSEKHAWLFEADRTLLRATSQGRRLQMQVFKAGKLIKQDESDYPDDSAPFEIVPLYMSAAVAKGVDHYDFELLVPGDGTHGIRVDVHRTRDLRRFAEGYRVPRARLHSDQPLAVAEMRLSSPLKALFYSHHFFMVFPVSHPDQLTMMWGGEGDSLMQAFRRP